MKYTWNIRDWIERNLRYDLRIDFWVAWLYVILKPIATLHNAFLEQSKDWDYKTKYTAQQGVLADLLNTIYDDSQKRIYITTDSNSVTTAIVFDEGETGQTAVVFDEGETGATMVVYDEDEQGLSGRFTVHVPSSLTGSEVGISQWVNYHKVSGTDFTIKYF